MKKIYFSITHVFFLAIFSVHSSYCQDDSLKRKYGRIFNSSTVVNARPILFNDISFNSGEQIAANFQYANKDNTQKIILAPLKFFNTPCKWNDLKLNITQKNAITTVGLGLTYDNSAGYSGRTERILKRHTIATIKREDDETDSAFAVRKAKYEKEVLNPPIVEIFRDRLKNSLSITGGYNISLFEIIGGDKVLNDDSLIGNKYQVKSHNISLDLTYSFNEKNGLSVGGVYKRQRNSPVEKQKMINYYGFNVTFSSWLFPLDKNYLKSNDYLNSLFASSVFWGISFEYLKADGDLKYAEDGIKYQWIFTPFLDFRISPKSQFRLGIPIRKYDTVNKNQVGLGPFVQYSLQFSQPN